MQCPLCYTVYLTLILVFCRTRLHKIVDKISNVIDEQETPGAKPEIVISRQEVSEQVVDNCHSKLQDGTSTNNFKSQPDKTITQSEKLHDETSSADTTNLETLKLGKSPSVSDKWCGIMQLLLL